MELFAGRLLPLFSRVSIETVKVESVETPSDTGGERRARVVFTEILNRFEDGGVRNEVEPRERGRRSLGI